jgi:hypothetical protein
VGGVVWWRPQRTTVWSEHGGRGRTITLTWTKAGRSLGGALMFGTVGSVMGALSATLLRTLHNEVDDVPAFLDAILGLWLVMGAVAALVLVRSVSDLVRRHTIEGAVVLRQRSALHDERGAVLGHRYYVAVDDGRSDTAAVYSFGFGFGSGLRSSLGAAMYRDVQAGDVVRLVVTHSYGRVVRYQPLRDHDGRTLPAGVLAEPDHPDAG